MSEKVVHTDLGRRRVLRWGLVGLVAVPLGQLAVQHARAEDLPLVDENDPMAQSLGYTPDSAQVDQAKYPNHTAEQFCHNCQFYTGKSGDPSGPCTIFPGKAVAANGWCTAWVPPTAPNA